VKKLLFTTVCLLSVTLLHAQYVQSTPENSTKSYYISADYGFGASAWNSDMKNTKLYDRYGAVIKTGDLQFKSQTSVRYQNLAVMIPVSDVVFGLGVNFEEHTMDKIEIKESITKAGEVGAGELMFDQKFRLDKFYALIEVPFLEQNKLGVSAAFQARLGYFGYYGLDRENFFGEEQIANAYFGSIGATATVKVMPRVYFYIHPKFEYNYFNNKSESSSSVTHHIYTFAVAGGIRIDVGGK